MTNNLTNGKSIGSPMVNNTDFDQCPTQTTILIPNEQFRTANQNGGAKQAAAGCGCMLTVFIFIYNCWVVGYNASL